MNYKKIIKNAILFTIIITLTTLTANATDFSTNAIACYNFDTDGLSTTNENHLALGSYSSISATQSVLGGASLYCGDHGADDANIYAEKEQH